MEEWRNRKIFWLWECRCRFGAGQESRVTNLARVNQSSSDTIHPLARTHFNFELFGLPCERRLSLLKRRLEALRFPCFPESTIGRVRSRYGP